ncbi:DUF3159 domain-containing protein [Flindersiella endophytica]
MKRLQGPDAEDLQDKGILSYVQPSESTTNRPVNAEPESLAKLLGGWRASADATLPPVAFVVGWLLAGHSVGWGAVASIVVGLAFAAYRMVRGEKPRAVLIGLLGVAVAAAVALYTGRAADFFLARIAVNAASALAWAVSIVVRRPLLGVVIGTVLRQGRQWRRDPALVRAYSYASWIWVLMYALRVVVLGLLYLADAVVGLGAVQILLGWPVLMICLVISGWVLYRVLPKGHPGFRHPVV